MLKNREPNIHDVAPFSYLGHWWWGCYCICIKSAWQTYKRNLGCSKLAHGLKCFRCPGQELYILKIIHSPNDALLLALLSASGSNNVISWQPCKKWWCPFTALASWLWRRTNNRRLPGWAARLYFRGSQELAWSPACQVTAFLFLLISHSSFSCGRKMATLMNRLSSSSRVQPLDSGSIR